MTIEILQQLIQKTKNQLIAVSLRIVGNQQTAEDVVQEVYIKIWNNKTQLSHIKNIESWCMTMTKNLSIDTKKSKHRRIVSMPDNFDIEEISFGPLQQLESSDIMSIINKVIDSLPTKQKNIIQLRDIKQMSYKEISILLNIPINQVKINLHRARKSLQTKLILIKKHEF